MPQPEQSKEEFAAQERERQQHGGRVPVVRLIAALIIVALLILKALISLSDLLD